MLDSFERNEQGHRVGLKKISFKLRMIKAYNILTGRQGEDV